MLTKKLKLLILTIIGFVIICPVCCSATTVMPYVSVNVNGRSLYINSSVSDIEDEAFVELRAVCREFKYPVLWIEDERAVSVYKNGCEYKLWIDSNHFVKNGELCTLSHAPYIFDDKTMVPLSFFSQILELNANFHFDIVEVELGQGRYLMVHISDYLGSKDDDLQTLLKFGIVTEEDIKKDEYITNRDFLNLANKLIGIPTNLQNWYRCEEFEPYNYLSDDDKQIIINLYENDFAMLSLDDIKNMDLDANLTNSDALKYIVRIVGDKSGVGIPPYVMRYTEDYEVYSAAYNIGILPSKDVINADSQITRENLYTLVNRAMYVRYYEGDWGGHLTSLNSKFENKQIER